jgi:hypothetical protein
MKPAIALNPRHFGRGIHRVDDVASQQQESTASDDLRLFATTFVAGFVFVSMLLV